MRRFLCITLLAGWAQGQSATPSFEVASIYATKGPVDSAFINGIQISGASVTMRQMSLENLITAAYGLKARFRSAPDWIESEPVFDIHAVLPQGASARLVPDMIQSLLAERFKLRFHIEQEERTVSALLLDKGGPKLLRASPLKESMPGGAVSGVFEFSNVTGSPLWSSPSGATYRISFGGDGGGRFKLTGASFDEFAFHLNTLEGVDLVDMTLLQGKYDFEWSATPEEMCELCPAVSPRPGQPGTPTPSTRESLRQLGLTIEKRRATIDVFVVDHLEKVPTEN